MVKGLIFGLDGTLLETSEDMRTAANGAMRDYGFPEYSLDEIKQKVGSGNLKLMERCLPEGEKHLASEALEHFKRHYAECYMDKTLPYEGLYEVVKECAERGLLLAVNTNKTNIYCENLIQKNFPGIHFMRILGNIDGYPTKPDPKGALEILEEMGLEKEKVLYVGDSDVDMRTANNAQLPSVWVSWGYRTYDQVESEHPRYVIHSPEELLELI